jgi:annexin A7/11
MTEIKAVFEKLFGESLRECIKGDTSGAYKHALYALIGEKSKS